MIAWIVIAILVVGICFLGWKNLRDSKEFKKAMAQANGGLTVDIKHSEMDLVYESMNECFLRTLYMFLTRDFEFTESSPTKLFVAGHFKDLVMYLLRPDIKLSGMRDGETTESSFFEFFMHSVYLTYVSETPEHIKNLLYKYHSGYNMDTYFVKKRAEPSCMHFLTKYARNRLWLLYIRLESESQGYLESIRSENPNGYVENYNEAMDDYDSINTRRLTLNIYHLTDTTAEMNEFSVSNAPITKVEIPMQTNSAKESTFKRSFEVDFKKDKENKE